MSLLQSSVGGMVIALATSGTAFAGIVDLGVAGSFNVYTLGDFKSENSDTEGAIAAAGNVSAKNYSINANNVDGAKGYSLVTGGNFSYTYGSVNNGSYYVDGTITKNGVGLNGATQSATSPVDFEATSRYVKSLSTTLATLAATGTMDKYYGGLKFTGGGNSLVDIFNIAGASLLTADQFVMKNLTPGQTIIFNVSGTEGMGFRPNGVGFDAFNNYNVLFNFYEATTNLSLKGVIGSVLAPLASVKDEYGVINGNVIVGSWNSHVQINANHYFKATDVAGFQMVSPTGTAGSGADLPEPATWTMIAGGLGLLAFSVRRKAKITQAVAVKRIS